MSAQKTERLLNLVICLLSTRQFLAKDQIRGRCRSTPSAPPTRPSTGCSSATRTSSATWASPSRPAPTTPGSRTRSATASTGRPTPLPEISFEPDELAVLGLALARLAAGQPRLARASRALLKLKADGIEPDDAQPGRHRAPGAHQRAGLRAGLRRRPRPPADHLPVPDVRGRRAPPAAPRAVGDRVPVRTVVRRRPRPRPAGHPRLPALPHRRCRVAPGSAGDVRVPEGVDFRNEVAALVPPQPSRSATLCARTDAGLALRRRASATRPGEDGWDELTSPTSTQTCWRRRSPASAPTCGSWHPMTSATPCCAGCGRSSAVTAATAEVGR